MDKDDIDDLLDEVESKYVKKTVSKTPAPSTTTTTTKTSSRVKSKSGLDEAIDDLLDLDVNHPSQSRADAKNKSKTSGSASAVNLASADAPKRSCLPAYLGGTSVDTGRGTSVNQLACDQLRCTSCDFRICFFDNMAWAKDTDYLFLRNNAPDFQRLKGKLLRKKGVRAYCCQCSWRNIQDLTDLTDPALKWVCGKHVS